MKPHIGTPETDELWNNWKPAEPHAKTMMMLARKLERERDEARRIASEACKLLDREGYQVNYPPMPWEPDSPEFVELDNLEDEE